MPAYPPKTAPFSVKVSDTIYNSSFPVESPEDHRPELRGCHQAEAVRPKLQRADPPAPSVTWAASKYHIKTSEAFGQMRVDD